MSPLPRSAPTLCLHPHVCRFATLALSPSLWCCFVLGDTACLHSPFRLPLPNASRPPPGFLLYLDMPLPCHISLALPSYLCSLPPPYSPTSSCPLTCLTTSSHARPLPASPPRDAHPGSLPMLLESAVTPFHRRSTPPGGASPSLPISLLRVPLGPTHFNLYGHLPLNPHTITSCSQKTLADVHLRKMESCALHCRCRCRCWCRLALAGQACKRAAKAYKHPMPL